MRKPLLILLLLPVIALANPQMHGEPPCEDMPPPKHYKPTDGTAPLPLLLHQINLTEKQRGEINTLVNARRAEIDAKLEEVRSIGMEIQRLSFSNDYSDSKLQMLFDNSSPIHREAALQKSRLNNAIFKLLTREQQEKLQTIMAHFKDCFI